MTKKILMEKCVYSDKELVEGLQKKDENAFQAFYDQYYRLIRFILLRMGAKESDILDIFWEAFIGLKKTVDKEGFQLENKLGTLLGKIALYIFYKKIRARKDVIRPWTEKVPERGEDDGIIKELIFRNRAEKEEQLELLNEKLDQLNKYDRDLIKFRYYENLKYKEIVHELHSELSDDSEIETKANALRQRVFQIISRLRNELNKK